MAADENTPSRPRHDSARYANKSTRAPRESADVRDARRAMRRASVQDEFVDAPAQQPGSRDQRNPRPRSHRQSMRDSYADASELQNGGRRSAADVRGERGLDRKEARDARPVSHSRDRGAVSGGEERQIVTPAGHGARPFTGRHPERQPSRRPSRQPSRHALRSDDGVSLAGTAGTTNLAENVHVPKGHHPPQNDVELAAAEVPRTNKKRHLAPVPGNEVNTLKDRMFPFTGIDNLALLMEDDSYHPACFSIYLFKTKLDYRTVRDFFEVLAQLYPKYRYVVDFGPYSASRRDRETRLSHEALSKASPEEQAAYRREKQAAANDGQLPINHGPRTTYAKSLKAGSYLRPARWRIDDDFHVSENINVMSCGGSGSDEELHRIAGRFLGRHFNFNKPVWEALLVQGLDTEEGAKSALMIKIHHCFSDGQGMIQSYHAALAAMTQNMGIKEVQQWVDIAKKKEKAKKETIKPSVPGTMAHYAYTLRELYLRKRQSFVYRNPKMPRAAQRLYCHSDGVHMEKIKLIRAAFSSEKMHLTLNDVAITILARAMRTASERMGEKHKDSRIALFIPISIRPPGNWDLFNYTTGSLTWIRYPDPRTSSIEEQMAQVQKEMLRLKKSYLPAIWYNMFNFVCKRRGMYLPNYPVWRQFFYRAFSEYHVATNVPGPTAPVSFGKHEAFSYHVLPPSSPGKATMAIGMISYANSFSLAVSCDDVDEFKALPRVLCDAFQEAASAIVESAYQKLGTKPEATS